MAAPGDPAHGPGAPGSDAPGSDASGSDASSGAEVPRRDVAAAGDGPTDTSATGPSESVDELEYGPSGYLPAKASARARKIVLRAPLGIQWVIGALVAGVVVLVAGGLWLADSGPPGPPFVATVELAEVDGTALLPELDALLVAAGGPVVVFADAAEHDLAWCEPSGRVEGDGVWSAATGRGFGVDSLDRHPAVVHDGTVYVDPDDTVPGPRPSDTTEQPTC